MINHLLRLIEEVVVIVLLAGIVYGSITLSSLNKLSKSSWALPTLTPTALIQPLILPGGGARSNPSVETRSNANEIPPHLQPMVQSNVKLPIPTSAPHQGIRIKIPALNIDAPIVQGDELEQLKKGVGQHIGTANPGEVGNLVLSGHNDTFGEVFRYLDRLKAGDQVIVFTYTRSYTYIVDGWKLVEPNQAEVMAPTPYESITLISCYPYLIDNQRIIVNARLQKD